MLPKLKSEKYVGVTIDFKQHIAYDGSKVVRASNGVNYTYSSTKKESFNKIKPLTEKLARKIKKDTAKPKQLVNVAISKRLDVVLKEHSTDYQIGAIRNAINALKVRDFAEADNWLSKMDSSPVEDIWSAYTNKGKDKQALNDWTKFIDGFESVYNDDEGKANYMNED